MNVETKAAQAVRGHEERDHHDEIAARVASWWWGGADDGISDALATAKLIAHEPINEAIYLARIAENTSKFRQLKEWGYLVAVEFVGAKGSGQRKRSMVESYRVDWGHQAARDGMARALWPWRLDEVPGRNAQCQRFGVGHQAYQRVRDEVEARTLEGFVNFMFDLACVVEGRWTRDMIARWEAVTGGEFDRASH